MLASTAALAPTMALSAPLTTPPRVGGLQSWALPAKLVKRILDLEYVDMAELVPDSWRFQEEEASKCCHQPKRHRRGPITNILLWVECYTSMVEVLCSAHPGKVAEFLSYLQTIVRAQRTFVGDGWVTYDMCFRRKAAAAKSLEWGQEEFTRHLQGGPK